MPVTSDSMFVETEMTAATSARVGAGRASAWSLSGHAAPRDPIADRAAGRDRLRSASGGAGT
ncbi:hypothetical protein [Microtetraspora glauca]|uniref:Uncharacterized protein n=1 Tax=Microtetraspora glauca TaxID=1996 RepID=A0ABV3GD39_MICGL